VWSSLLAQVKLRSRTRWTMHVALEEQIVRRFSHPGAATIRIPSKPMHPMLSTLITRGTLCLPVATLGGQQCSSLLIQVQGAVCLHHHHHHPALLLDMTLRPRLIHCHRRLVPTQEHRCLMPVGQVLLNHQILVSTSQELSIWAAVGGQPRHPTGPGQLWSGF